MTATGVFQPVALRASAIGASLGQGAARHRVLHDVSLAIDAGRWTCIVGPNGAGKSTLLQCMAGILPCSGAISLLNQPLQRMPHRLRARSLAWLGQNEASADDLNVWDVAMLGRLPHLAWLAQPKAEDYAAVEQALHDTQAWEWRHRALHQLSGGERQRVLLARALAVQAPVLLLDEPLANLDPPHQADWLMLVRKLVAQGTTVVSVLHELNMALHADSMVIMQGGRLLHHGSCADPLTRQALEAVFNHRIAIHPLHNQWVALPHQAMK